MREMTALSITDGKCNCEKRWVGNEKSDFFFEVGGRVHNNNGPLLRTILFIRQVVQKLTGRADT
jgi:hypothetical protein